MRRIAACDRTVDDIWYPSPRHVIGVNVNALRLSGDRHPHKILGSVEGIAAVLDRVKAAEGRGLSYQAALIIREFTRTHVFAGANHRTAYILAKLFLAKNGRRISVSDFGRAYPFMRDIERRSLEEIQEWVECGAFQIS